MPAAVLCRRGTDLGADPGRHATDSAADALAAGGPLADRRREHPARQDTGHPRLRTNRQHGRRLRKGVRDEGARVGAAAVAGCARKQTVTTSRRASALSTSSVTSCPCTCDWSRRPAGIVTAADLVADEADRAAGQHQPRSTHRTRRPRARAAGRTAREWPRSTFSRKSRCAIRTTRCSRWTTSYARRTSATSREMSIEIQFSDVFDQIVAYAEGRPINVVNPTVLERLL